MTYRRARPLLITLALALVLGLAGGAGRAIAQPRVAVVGDDAQVVAAMAEALRAHRELAVVTVSAPPVVDERLAGVLAIEHELSAVVTVRVSVDGATWTASAIAYEGREGFVIGRFEVRSPVAKLAAAAAAQTWKKLGPALTLAEPPPPSATPAGGTTTTGTGRATTGTGRATTGTGTGTTTGSGTTTTDEPPSGTDDDIDIEGPPADADEPLAGSDEPPTRVAADPEVRPGPGADIVTPIEPRRAPRNLLRVGAGFKPFQRRLRYTDDIRDATRPYKQMVNAVALDARLQPLASLPLALTAALEMSIGGTGVTDESAMKYDTRATEWSVGLGYGAEVGPATLAARVGYGQQTFRIDDDTQPGAEQVPDMDYRWVRAAAEAQVELVPRWRLEAGAGYRYLLETGDLFNQAWFPRGSGHGVDGEVGIRFALRPRIDIFAAFEVRHYFFAMNPVLGDELIVGGAEDTFLGGAVGASISAF